MPNRPYRLCSQQGCTELVIVGNRYCAAHTQTHVREQRTRYDTHTTRASRPWHTWYSTPTWRSARAAYLSRNPLCVQCETEGILTPAIVIDHITPHQGNHGLFWDSNNWQSLCATCHNIKTAAEDGGFKNKKTKKSYF